MTQTKDGFGATLLVTSESHTHTLNELQVRIKVRKFTETSSTKIELQTLLWALAEVPKSSFPLTVYTDSQNILSLVDRRAGLEALNFHSKKGLPLNNAALYRAFFEMVDQKDFKLVKVKGHKSAAKRDSIDRLFNLVDKASRKACRKCRNALLPREAN